MKTPKVLTILAAASAITGSVYGQVPVTTIPQTSTGEIPDYESVIRPSLLLSGNVFGLDTSKTWYVYSVSLNLSGATSGINGDIFAKLIYGDQASAILLNRAGTGSAYGSTTGYANDGMSFTFVRDGYGTTVDAHAYQTSPGYSTDAGNKAYGTFTLDGRETITTGTTDPRTKLLNSFDGKAVNSSLWGLYLQDFQSGGKLKVDSWSISFTEVPEPSEYAMLAGLGLIGFAAYRRYSVKTA